MAVRTYVILILVTWTILLNVDGAKVLFLAQLTAKSHFHVFEPVINGLATRNHDITLYSFHPLKTNHSNVKWMKIAPINDGDPSVTIDLEEEARSDVVFAMRGWTPFFTMMCEHLLTQVNTKTLLDQGKQFDLVVVDALFADCATVLAAMLGKHTVYLFTSGLFPWLENSVPYPPSYVPNIIAPLPSKMSFVQRMQNSYYVLGMKTIYEFEITPATQEVISKLLPQAPTITEAVKKVAFYITNADPVMYDARPSMPHVAHCGGMHCGETKPLPKDLEEFIQSSGDNGFIIFGLGSGVTAKMLKPDFIQAFISAFERLKQKIIWKFDDDLETLPANVKTISWMPQQDLLGHPKIRLFITHGGLLSLQEAIYHAVPVIPIPLFAEQPGNAARVKEIGIGEPLSFLNITADGIYETVTKILNDYRYYENVKKCSAVFKDRPEKPVEQAVFWIEYVLRHDGARHLRSAGEDLNFFQYFLLDAVALVVATATAVVGIVLCVFKLVIRSVLGKKRSADAKKTN